MWYMEQEHGGEWKDTKGKGLAKRIRKREKQGENLGGENIEIF